MGKDSVKYTKNNQKSNDKKPSDYLMELQHFIQKNETQNKAFKKIIDSIEFEKKPKKDSKH